MTKHLLSSFVVRPTKTTMPKCLHLTEEVRGLFCLFPFCFFSRCTGSARSKNSQALRRRNHKQAFRLRLHNPFLMCRFSLFAMKWHAPCHTLSAHQSRKSIYFWHGLGAQEKTQATTNQRQPIKNRLCDTPCLFCQLLRCFVLDIIQNKLS